MDDYTPENQQEDDDLYEHYAFTAEKGQQPLRIDKYLMNFIENATRNKIQAAAKNGNIYVNDVAVKQNYKVKPLDKIRVLFEHPPYEYLLTPEDLPPIEILLDFESSTSSSLDEEGIYNNEQEETETEEGTLDLERPEKKNHSSCWKKQTDIQYHLTNNKKNKCRSQR